MIRTRRNWLRFACALAAITFVTSSARADDREEGLKIFKRGKTHYLLQDYPQAIKDWERAAKLLPNTFAVHANLAKAYSAVGRLRDALASSRRAIKFRMSPKAGANIWGDIGILENRLGNPRKAVEAQSRARDLEPERARHYFNLAVALRETGRSQAALEAYEDCLDAEHQDLEQQFVQTAKEMIIDLKLVLERQPGPTLSSSLDINRSREKSAWLDLDGARATLKSSGPADPDVKRELEELRARAKYLDALGAAIAPDTKVVVAQNGARARLTKASAKGLKVQGRTAPVPWHELPRGTALSLVAATEASVKGTPLGAALVLSDLGLWALADRRIKSWVDADPTARARAFELLARYRGLAEVPKGGFEWKGSEWITPAEGKARAKDHVTVDKKRVTRSEARKLVKQQQRTRRSAKRGGGERERTRLRELRTKRGVVDVRTIVSSGDPLKRADVVVVSDGFTTAELGTFKRLAGSVAKTVLTIEPFKNYARYVNVHRVTVVAERSGLGGSRVGAKQESEGMLSCDTEKAASYGRLAPDADLVIVIVNVKQARPTGMPGLITMDASADFSQVVLHELGHAIAGLDDEYADATVLNSYPDYGPEQEREHLNTTRQSDPRLAKWHYWLLPPALPPQEKIGCFEGGYYREQGYYHPAKTCRMRETEAIRYCAVCLEQMELSFYKRIEPIDDVNVRTPHIRLWKGETRNLSATTIAISKGLRRLGGFKAQWYVDDRPAASRAVKTKRRTTSLKLRSLKLAPGTHEVVLRVDLRDVRVRRDGGMLSSLRAWRVNVSDTPPPRIVAPKRVRVRRGELVKFEIRLKGGSSELLPRLRAPGGSAQVRSSDRSVQVVWAPPRHARGLYKVEVSLGDWTGPPAHATEILIQDGAGNVPPVLRDQGVIVAKRGQELVQRLEAFDADGDGLVFTSTDLPPGARLDPMTGILHWTPSYSTPLDPNGAFTVRVSDGTDDDEVKIKAKVENRPIEAGGSGFDVLLATRAISTEVRHQAIGALLRSELPRGGKLLELVRLLRDADPGIASKALEMLKTALEVTEQPTRGLIALDLAEYTWSFVDRPKVLSFLETFLRSPLPTAAKKAAERIRKELSAISAYNQKRGVK